MAEARTKELGCTEARIKEIYNKLEGLTFRALFDDVVTMRRFLLSVPRRRPVYLVKDTHTNNVLDEIYRDMRSLERELGGKEIWKGITTASGGTYKLWGTEESVGVSGHGVYYIPIGGVEVIVNRTVDYQAIVNITVEKGRRKQLLVCLFNLHQLFMLQKFM